MAAEDGDEHNASDSWVNNYDASYQYGSTWAAVIFPIFGLLGIALAWRSEMAVAVAIGAELLFILGFFEWKTYYIRVSGDSISRGSFMARRLRLPRSISFNTFMEVVASRFSMYGTAIKFC
jgi:hypothetical protein